MSRVRPLLLTFVLSTGAAVGQSGASSDALAPSSPPALLSVASNAADIPFDNDESQAERLLLQLANQSRRQAGLRPLTLDPGLSKAAREHALAMSESRHLSHQLRGEPTLPQRLASASPLLLDRQGENVALDYSAERGHEHLMLSPPHRANLLDPSYNVVGLGVLRSGDRLYIVQDFGRALPTYTAADTKALVAAAVQQKRHQAGRRELPRRDLPSADEAACSMARADKVGSSIVRNLAEQFTVLTYTSFHPEILPNQAYHALTSPRLRSFSIGTCFARTATYPAGVYWVVLTLD